MGGKDDPEVSVGNRQCPRSWALGCWLGQGGQTHPRTSLSSRPSAEMQRGDQIASWISCCSKIWQFRTFGWAWTAAAWTQPDSLLSALPWHNLREAGVRTKGISVVRDRNWSQSEISGNVFFRPLLLCFLLPSLLDYFPRSISLGKKRQWRQNKRQPLEGSEDGEGKFGMSHQWIFPGSSQAGG